MGQMHLECSGKYFVPHPFVRLREGMREGSPCPRANQLHGTERTRSSGAPEREHTSEELKHPGHGANIENERRSITFFLQKRQPLVRSRAACRPSGLDERCWADHEMLQAKGREQKRPPRAHVAATLTPAVLDDIYIAGRVAPARWHPPQRFSAQARPSAPACFVARKWPKSALGGGWELWHRRTSCTAGSPAAKATVSTLYKLEQRAGE